MNWKIYTFALKKFFKDAGFLHASALTFYTLFAVVPVLATAFGISKGFGLENFLNQQIERLFPGQEEMVSTLSVYAQNLLHQSSGGLIAGVGILILFYSVYSVLSHIEATFNQVWQVPTPRRMSVRINHYLALLFIAPVALILAGSLKLFITDRIAAFSPALALASGIISLLLFVAFFSWFYAFVPNTFVKRNAAIFSGLQTGIVYSIVQTILIESQILLNNYGAVYGSLAVFPIFLIWIQVSWVMVIYGAQLCFVYQNQINADWQLDLNSLAPSFKQELSLKIVQACVAEFKADRPPLNVDQLADELQIPACCIQQLLLELVEAGILAETLKYTELLHGYVPAKNADLLDADAVIKALADHGVKAN